MKYLSLLSLIPFIFSGIACSNHKEMISDSVWYDYQNPIITRASLTDTLPPKLLNELSPVVVKGVKVVYHTGRSTRYFSYKADSKKLLSLLPTLPFSMRTNARIDTTYQRMNNPFSLAAKDLLSIEEQKAASFFWQINPEEFEYYEYNRGRSRHTFLFSKRTNTILHRIESV